MMIRPCCSIITETSPPEVNGVARTIAALVEELCRRGHSIELVRPRQGPRQRPVLAPGVEEVLVPGLRLPRSFDLRVGLPSGRMLRTRWLHRRPDVTHVVTEGPLGWSAVTAARCLAIPVSSGFHTNVHSYSRHYGLRLLTTTVRRYLRALHNHQQESAPRMQALHDWMAKQLEDHAVEPNSGLGQAITYMQNHGEKLTLFLRVPGAPLSNNICERALKKAILHRKNSLVYRTLNGAKAGDLFMSLIHTAELHQVEPFEYLVALQRHEAAVALDPAAWMPWRYTEALARIAADAPDPAPD